MLPSELKALKKRWRTCLWFMHHELDDRFPHDSMEVYELLKVVNPSISHSALVHAEVAGIPKAEAVKTLLHIFELPLHGYLVSETVINSFASFLTSVVARDKFKAMNVKTKGKFPPPTMIYSYYSQLLSHKELRNWAFFALFLLLFPTGNAISERGFSAVNATNTKGRYAMSVKQSLATMIISFNGPTYEAFKQSLDADSISQGVEWWGFVPPTNFNR
jgi:hypothetical protein